jgi:hypothetical protein
VADADGWAGKQLGPSNTISAVFQHDDFSAATQAARARMCVRTEVGRVFEGLFTALLLFGTVVLAILSIDPGIAT